MHNRYGYILWPQKLFFWIDDQTKLTELEHAILYKEALPVKIGMRW